MATLHRGGRTSRTLPPDDYSTAALAHAVRGANHDTSLAAWAVCCMAVGVLVQLPALASIGQTVPAVLLTTLLLPLLGAFTQIVRLLNRAAAAVGATVSATQLLAGLETRGAWAARAAVWSGATGAAFAAWSVAVQTLSG